jgi:hypothetical protein
MNDISEQDQPEVAVPVQTSVNFDPFEPEHRVAYVMLAHECRQHPTLRFICNEQYKTTLDMMRCKLADAMTSVEIFERGSIPKSVTIPIVEEVKGGRRSTDVIYTQTEETMTNEYNDQATNN